MVNLYNEEEIKLIKQASEISAKALKLAGELCVEGISTWEIDANLKKFILSQGAVPNFLNYNGFPATSCISVNDVIIHGIPSKKVVLKNGDVVSVDVGANFSGYNGDNAFTFQVGSVSKETQQLLKVTQDALFCGIKSAIVGNRIGDVSNAIESYITPFGYGIVKEFVGHGVGRRLHESPEIPNYGEKGRGVRLFAGMVIAIEPMVNLKSPNIKNKPGQWEVRTADGEVSAHFEHTVLVSDDGPQILTAL